MSYRAIYDSQGLKAEYRDGECIWLRDGVLAPEPSTQIMPDIQPYRSMVDGSMITSRSRHREHLRQHNCIEVGNETMKSVPVQAQSSRRELLHRRLGDMSDRQANKILNQLRRD